MRVNCAEEPTFWLEIKMGKAPFNDLRPDGDTAKNLKRANSVIELLTEGSTVD